MKSNLEVLKIALLFIIILVNDSCSVKSSAMEKKYNWNLEIVKPQGYNIEIKNITYLVYGKEIYRSTSSNPFSTWSGLSSGVVLHSKARNQLPEIVRILWQEVDTKKDFEVEFLFPRKKIIDLWNENYDLLIEKWGDGYPKGQLSVSLGISPSGLLVLWLSDLDINTAPFAIEVENYRSTVLGVSREENDKLLNYDVASQIRFSTPRFYMSEAENVVAINILFHNGESCSINKIHKNNSILEVVNSERGWSLAKRIDVHWFNANGDGYVSTYTVDEDFAFQVKDLDYSKKCNIVYLLDRPNSLDGSWNDIENKFIIELSESGRKEMSRN